MQTLKNQEIVCVQRDFVCFERRKLFSPRFCFGDGNSCWNYPLFL
nr:MAG TPA: hypothetical protein [Caudoviricetes sp.]